MKKTMLSGIKPSGQLHLGNYIGALKNFVKYQDDYQMIVFVANLHCITMPIEATVLRKNLKDAIALYLAAGLNPEKSILFLQSDVMAHAQLGHIFQCFTYLGELNRMTQYKDKMAKKETNLSVGMYTYPDLMAADILIYDADYVPVGIDQKQHVELARDLAVRLNNRYETKLFTLPEPLIEKIGSKIYSLQDPTVKMSKSDKSEKGIIYLLDDVKVAAKKIMSAVTDSINKIQFDPINQPGIANLITIYSALTNESIEAVCEKFKDAQYGTFKRAVAEVVVNFLTELQQKYQKIVNSSLIDDILNNGSKRANQLATQKLKSVQQAIGLEISND